jgi:hypothetical protein
MELRRWTVHVKTEEGPMLSDVLEGHTVGALGIENIARDGYWHRKDDLLGGIWVPPHQVVMVQVVAHVPVQGGK